MPSATIALLIAAAAAIAALAFALRDAQRHISTLEAHLAALGVREVDSNSRSPMTREFAAAARERV